MAKKNKSEKKIQLKVHKDGRCVDIQEISKYAEKIYLPYAATTNIARITPELRDGLKPVQRRIIWDMYHDKKRRPSLKASALVKVAAVVGDVMGTYHPHGDTAIGDALVGLAQWWKCTPCILRPEGNFGTIAGQGNAAYRYISCNISHFAYDTYFDQYNPILSDFKPTYDNKHEEPEFLPSAFPIVLVKGGTGIGTGTCTTMPNYNLGEVADLTLELIKNPNKKKCMLIPDYPCGADIEDTDFEKICRIGEGNITSMSTMIINDRGELEIISLPYNVTLIAMIGAITKLRLSGELCDVVDMLDASSKTPVNPINGCNETAISLRLTLGRGADVESIKSILYKKGLCKKTSPIRMNLVYDYELIRYNVKSYILDWLEFRRDTISRRLIQEYSDKNKRYMLLETIIKVISKPNSDKILTGIMRKSEDRAAIIIKLIHDFDINDLQAEIIADFKFSQLSKSALQKYKAEYDILDKELTILYDTMHSDGEIDRNIIADIKAFKQKYASPRRCMVVPALKKGDVANTKHIVMISDTGNIKKLMYDETDPYTLGVVQPKTNLIDAITIFNTDRVLIFTKAGKCIGLKVSDIPTQSIDNDGIHISTYGAEEGDTPIAIISQTDKTSPSAKLIFLTKKGTVKSTNISLFNNAGKSGIAAITLNDEKDELVSVVSIGSSNKPVMIVTQSGDCLRFNSKEISSTQRNSSGVIGVKPKKKDVCIKLVCTSSKDTKYAMLTSKGGMKISDVPEISNRSKAMKKIVRLDDKEKIIDIKAIRSEDDITVVKNTGLVEISYKKIKKTSKIDSCKKSVSKKVSEALVKIL